MTCEQERPAPIWQFIMWIHIWLRGEKALSMHLVKVLGAKDSPKGTTLLISHPLKRKSQKRSVMGGLYGCTSKHLSDPPIKNSRLYTFARGSSSKINILNRCFLRARFRCLRSRMSLSPPFFLGTKNDYFLLVELFPWRLFVSRLCTSDWRTCPSLSCTEV